MNKLIIIPPMRTRQKSSTNDIESLYMRDDYWANGYFDFLWKESITPEYRARLDAIKKEATAKYAKSSKSTSNHYPRLRK